MVTTEVTEEDSPSSPLPQSPPAGKPVGPAVPESREVKSRSVKTKLPENPLYLLIFLAWSLNTLVCPTHLFVRAKQLTFHWFFNTHIDVVCLHFQCFSWQAGVGVDSQPSLLSSRERLCAFCYCGSRSLLGQGDLQVFSITPQLEALFSNKDGGGSASESSDGDKTTQPKMPGETTSGQRAKTK